VAHSLTLSARHPTHLPFYLYVKNVCKQQRKEQQHIANKSGKKKHIAKWLALTLRRSIAAVLVSWTPDWTSLLANK